MSSLIDMIKGQLGESAMRSLAGRIGADEGTTRQAIGAALPTMIGALQRNAESPTGAESLHRALESDHDGGLLDQLQEHVAGATSGRAANGEGILNHLLGSKRESVEQKLGASVGLDQSKMGSLMSILGPVIMGNLGRQKKEAGFDMAGLAGFLGQERAQIEKAEPKAKSLLGGLLDQDGDGDADLGDVAAGLFKKFF